MIPKLGKYSSQYLSKGTWFHGYGVFWINRIQKLNLIRRKRLIFIRLLSLISAYLAGSLNMTVKSLEIDLRGVTNASLQPHH